MKKRGQAILLSICILAGAAGCGTGKEVTYPGNQQNADETGEINTGEINTDKEAADMLRNGINGFAYQMYEKLNTGEDIFFSPYSLCSALSLLDIGAGTETKAELEKMLGITDLDTWNKEMQSFLAREWSNDTYVMTANSIWMQQDKEWAENIETEFLKPAEAYYDSELYQVDFKENTQAADNINGWVNENTKGMIPSIVNTISPETVMALLNAVYFEGKWEEPFLEKHTHEEDFYGANGDSRADMMNQYNVSCAYVEKEGIKGVSLPYKDSGIAMKIFIPVEEDADIGELFLSLDTEEKEALLNSLDEAEEKELFRLAVPKFTMEKEIKGLKEILESLGMESAFLANADFDKIGLDTYVSEVIHKAKIIVDEQGTKAAAVTGVMMTESCAFIEEQEEFVANRPFFYVLQDTQTGIILFMGQINNLD